MLAVERHELILRFLRRARFAPVGRIAALAASSEATVRRDLERMERAGLLRRVRGGAEIVAEAAQREGLTEPPLDERTAILAEAKRRIARAAVELCEDGETVIIDGGSTTWHMAEFLLPVRLRVVTNSFAIARALVGRFAGTVILGGGTVYPESQLVLDPFAEDMFRNYSATKLFMGVYGIDETGATNTETLLIRTERAMIERARELVILADSGKFQRRGGLALCGFDRISTIVTDAGISREARDLVASRGVRLIVA
jgi:DeoR family transcriptional regulator, ulaG and ulaABCDEF operon transcriptional repressor